MKAVPILFHGSTSRKEGNVCDNSVNAEKEDFYTWKRFGRRSSGNPVFMPRKVICC